MEQRVNNRFGLILCGVVLFVMFALYSWDMKSCFDPDELFYYKSSQSLSDYKNIFAPKYFNEPRFQKPPLFYLLVFLSFKLFGVSWFSARLVSVAASVLTVVVVYLLGLKMFDREKAFLAAGATATAALFFRFGRVALPEMTMLFFIVTAAYFGYRAFTEKRTGLFYAAFLAMALGTFVKGPIAFIIPLAVFIVFKATNRRELEGVNVPWFKGSLLVAASALLWLVPAALIYGREFTNHIVGVEIVDRFKDKSTALSLTGQAAHYFKKISFYFPVLIAQYLPWSAILPGALLFTIKNRARPDRPLERKYLVLWVVTGFIFFTALPAKRMHYVMSLFPFLSLYLVSFLDLEDLKLRKVMKNLLYTAVGVYLASAVLLFPLIFSDGVDRLAVKAKVMTEKDNVPLAVSWRLDPQEVELHLDRPVVTIWGGYFDDRSKKTSVFDGVELTPRRDGLLFYLLADERFMTGEGTYYITFVLDQVKRFHGDKIRLDKVNTDWRWRKTILFKKCIEDTRKDPGSVIQNLERAFQEDVHLIGVYKE
ncbi:MAG: glycosyltransferase family 39 protein [Candidatus Omnitrophica bacterium]|nr:glycosyltransferase family 39 protein [Candidatus Omnitrophota bacterium]